MRPAAPSFVGATLAAVRWANAGQAVAALDDMPPAMADAILTMRAEWDAIHAEANAS